ncbi:MAG: hypothetical protein CVV21_02800 [Candidatus Goldiibacteriota bacterium HGW-Goldbacteria-1]|jgi:hypothetical protein|nr:MAG: hypothetical protein CVV21_02800 [Candidatus Goldiibacteriota bacterium HGW-Goldbacteria-1]
MAAKKNGNSTETKADYFRVSLTLPKELDDYLEKFGSEAKSKGGFKLAKTTIIRSMVRALMHLKVDLQGVKQEEELEKRIEAAFKKNGK